MNKDCEGSKIMHIKNIVSSLQCLTLDDAFLKYYHQLIAFNAECQLSKKVKQYVELKRKLADINVCSKTCLLCRNEKMNSKYMIDKMIKTKQTIINKANRKVDLVEKFNTQSYKYLHNHNATYDQ